MSNVLCVCKAVVGMHAFTGVGGMADTANNRQQTSGAQPVGHDPLWGLSNDPFIGVA